jgi:hypothetical protein
MEDDPYNVGSLLKPLLKNVTLVVGSRMLYTILVYILGESHLESNKLKLNTHTLCT